MFHCLDRLINSTIITWYFSHFLLFLFLLFQVHVQFISIEMQIGTEHNRILSIRITRVFVKMLSIFAYSVSTYTNTLLAFEHYFRAKFHLKIHIQATHDVENRLPRKHTQKSSTAENQSRRCEDFPILQKINCQFVFLSVWQNKFKWNAFLVVVVTVVSWRENWATLRWYEIAIHFGTQKHFSVVLCFTTFYRFVFLFAIDITWKECCMSRIWESETNKKFSEENEK